MLPSGPHRLDLDMQHHPSCNFNERPEGTCVDTVVIHATVLNTFEEVIRHFENAENKVSSHYTIDRDGTIAAHVAEDKRAWHAGRSRMADGRCGVNDFSIGIELVNRNDGKDPFPKRQLDALRDLLSAIIARHPIRHIIPHYECADPPGRKSDPVGFSASWIAGLLNSEVPIYMKQPTGSILLGKGELPVYLRGSYANRHGLVAGATGTGKTVSLLLLAEGFSRLGVPVFMADVKGDVAGLGLAGTANERIQQRLAKLGLDFFAPEASPVVFWDLYGKAGHPVRTTVSEIGPQLLSRILELNDTQSGTVDIAFKLADDRGLLLLDFDDLRALLGFVADKRKEISKQYGLVSSQSIAAIQRALLSLEREGGDTFLGEPALELGDLLRTDLSGRGIVNILAADQLILKPRLFSSFLLWLLSELFEKLPEVGDLDRPRLVFFFDEAHLLFDDAPPSLRQRVEQVVRIIRSKGVGVYFCSQYPDDIPGEILGQLGNRIQHALRAYTPRDQKAVRAAAETFVAKPGLNVAEVIGQLGVGEALVSTLQENGVPMPVERTLMCPPGCRIGAVTPEERAELRARSPIGGKYDARLNRESAYEVLNRRAVPEEAPAEQSERSGEWGDLLWGNKRRQGMVETMAKQAARTVGSQIGRRILRGVLGGILGSGTRAR
jgi:DNA helicase HerA-like ATPase